LEVDGTSTSSSTIARMHPPPYHVFEHMET
jgi:hypothetical protein